MLCLFQIPVMLVATTRAKAGSAYHAVLASSSPSGVRPHAGHAPLTQPLIALAQSALPCANKQSVFTALPPAWP